MNDPPRVLSQAAASGDDQQVAAVLSSGAPPDLRENGSGRTALDLAVWNNHPNVVRILLAAGADPDAEMGEYGETTALRHSAPRRMREVAQLLLDAGANPNGRKNTNQSTPLILTAAQGEVEMVELLLDRGASPDLAVELQLVEGGAEKLGFSTRVSPLSSAAWGGHLETVRLLLARGARPDNQVLQSLKNGMARAEKETAPSTHHRGTRHDFALIREIIEESLKLS
ncbi:ankyrin repeat domain-containing protein [Streptomyces sp. NBC_00727]|uniref:ankyrin repeat domain-containing protein n=1 Tax=Streptomyces sp. NBC_00727 TaxID=2903675 RepID=UPI0038656C6F